MSQLSKNTADLDALIAKANALPDAGSGGGGAVETCTVTVIFTGGAAGYGESVGANIIYNKVVSGAIETTSLNITQDVTAITNIARGSSVVICLMDEYSLFGDISTLNFTILDIPGSYQYFYKMIFGSTNASEATITFGA